MITKQIILYIGFLLVIEEVFFLWKEGKIYLKFFVCIVQIKSKNCFVIFFVKLKSVEDLSNLWHLCIFCLVTKRLTLRVLKEFFCYLALYPFAYPLSILSINSQRISSLIILINRMGQVNGYKHTHTCKYRHTSTNINISKVRVDKVYL